MFKITLPRRIIRLRELFGWSQSALALRAHVALSTLNEMEQGFALNPKILTLIAVGGPFVVTPDFLLGLETNLARPIMDPRLRAEFANPNAELLLNACPVCSRVLMPGRLHTTGECVMFAHESGHNIAYLASLFGLTVGSVEKILEEEYRIRRRRTS